MEKEKKELVFQEAGKYLLDISKLVFGGVVLAGIMKLDVNYCVLFVSGLAVTVFCGWAGLILIALSKNKQ